MKRAVPKPCNQCPFRRNSMRGYLGPWTGRVLDFLHDALSEGGFACHKTIKVEGVWTPDTRVCAGSLIFANKGAKHYRPGTELAKLQQEMPNDDNIMNIVEFVQYHNRKET